MRSEARPRRKLELYCACGANQRVDAWQMTEAQRSRIRVRFLQEHAGDGHGELTRRQWEEAQRWQARNERLDALSAGPPRVERRLL